MDEGTRLGHTSLFILGRNQTGQRAFRHYDTANSHREHARNLAVHGNIVQTTLRAFGWPQRDQTSALPPATDPRHRGRQTPHSQECGILIVLFSWAHALGLDFSAFGTIRASERANFQRQAPELINLALRGDVGSETIAAFLRCFRIVAPNVQVPANRQFGGMVTFRSTNELTEHIARTRIIEDVTRMQETNPELGPLVQTTSEQIYEATWRTVE